MTPLSWALVVAVSVLAAGDAVMNFAIFRIRQSRRDRRRYCVSYFVSTDSGFSVGYTITNESIMTRSVLWRTKRAIAKDIGRPVSEVAIIGVFSIEG